MKILGVIVLHRQINRSEPMILHTPNGRAIQPRRQNRKPKVAADAAVRRMSREEQLTIR